MMYPVTLLDLLGRVLGPADDSGMTVESLH